LPEAPSFATGEDVDLSFCLASADLLLMRKKKQVFREETNMEAISYLSACGGVPAEIVACLGRFGSSMLSAGGTISGTVPTAY